MAGQDHKKHPVAADGSRRKSHKSRRDMHPEDSRQHGEVVDLSGDEKANVCNNPGMEKMHAADKK